MWRVPEELFHLLVLRQIWHSLLRQICHNVHNPLQTIAVKHHNKSARLTFTMAQPLDQRFSLTCEGFCTGFEKCFQIDGNGALKCDAETQRLITEWYNPRRMMIALITGVDMDELRFDVHPGRGGIEVSQRNKKKLLAYYSFAFTAYVKYCQTLKRNLSPRYRAVMEIVSIADE